MKKRKMYTIYVGAYPKLTVETLDGDGLGIRIPTDVADLSWAEVNGLIHTLTKLSKKKHRRRVKPLKTIPTDEALARLRKKLLA